MEPMTQPGYQELTMTEAETSGVCRSMTMLTQELYLKRYVRKIMLDTLSLSTYLDTTLVRGMQSAQSVDSLSTQTLTVKRGWLT